VSRTLARKTGSLVVDRLRDRILVGSYFGRWGPGDRLPSARDVARLEDVDRKTAAAAYRSLETEGLVRIEPRSGVYLTEANRDTDGDPLRRLQRRWLEQALTAAAELGLESRSVAAMLECVLHVEARRVPLVDPDRDHGAALAVELARRTGLQFAPQVPAETRARLVGGAAPPFVVATPAAGSDFGPAQPRPAIVRATLSPDLLSHLEHAVAAGPVDVVVATPGMARELARALDQGLVPLPNRVRVVTEKGGALGAFDGGRGRKRVLWPGTTAAKSSTDGHPVEDLSGWNLLSAATITRVRREVVRSAMRAVSTSSVGGWTRTAAVHAPTPPAADGPAPR
jgi:GntR family transcriptional regulator